MNETDDDMGERSRKRKKTGHYLSKTPKRSKKARIKREYRMNEKQHAARPATDESAPPMSAQKEDPFTFVDETEQRDLPLLKVVHHPSKMSTPISNSRKIVKLSAFVEAIRSVESHSTSCNFGGTLVHTGTQKYGLSSVLKFECSNRMCSKFVTVSTANPQEINNDAVSAAVSIGVGFSQCEEFFSVLQMSFMSNTVYQKYENIVGTQLRQVKEEIILQSIEEEKRAAEIEGDVTEEGYFKIAVTVDGGWSKRTYGHAFNANSGVGVIIGDRTNKILFTGVRNKYCAICKSPSSDAEHVCNKNWAGSSTSMEADIIVEGIRLLYENHKIIVTKLIGDGDSSVIKRIRERIPYITELGITKVECTNHAIRNFKRKMYNLSQNSKIYSGKSGLAARKLLKPKIEPLCNEIRRIILENCEKLKLDSSPANVTAVCVSAKVALRHFYLHIFGDHSHCPESDVNHEEPTTDIDILKNANMLAAIEEAVIFLCTMSNSLVLNKTSNVAENFMGAVAKVSGGKRVDYSKGQSYGRRVSAAVLSHSLPGQKWHEHLYWKVHQKTPPTPMARMIKKRTNKLITNAKFRLNRKLFQNTSELQNKKTVEKPDLEYDACDTSDDTLQEMCKDYYETQVCISAEQICRIEENTRQQSECILWKQERRKRITASNVREIAKRQDITPSANLVSRLVHPKEIRNCKSILWGKTNEDRARKKYEELYNCKVRDCGLFVDKDNPFLAASPDGYVEIEGETLYIIEIKCPYSARYSKNMHEACATIPKFALKKARDETLFLPSDHAYFYQIQTQLHCTNLNKCDLIFFIPNDVYVITITRDHMFMENIMEKLSIFYNECMLPELAHSRRNRNLPLREPIRILENIEKNRLKLLEEKEKKKWKGSTARKQNKVVSKKKTIVNAKKDKLQAKKRRSANNIDTNKDDCHPV